MPTIISPLAQVSPKAEIGDNVEIGPFCLVGPHVRIGEGTKLDSHVTIVGHTTIGCENRFFPNVVIGGEPQDKSYRESKTRTEIGDDNYFREGVTVNRGAEKEDHVTRIGNHNMLMANSHVAHNCHVYNDVILVNGVLLGGHVHAHDGAIVSGNSVVHHFSTLGTLSFVSGGCRVPNDVPPYMLAAGSDNPAIKTVNVVGMRRRGISESTIRIIKRAHRLIFREHKPLDAVHEFFHEQTEGVIPIELTTLLSFIERQHQGKMGRAREAMRDRLPDPSQNTSPDSRRRAA
jgi:UDP-N-acetylglucosamine acyltransferase